MTYDIMITKRCRKIIQIKCPIDIFNCLKRYSRCRQEHFLVLTFNGAHEVISIHISTIGLVNKTVAHPREVLTHAIKDNAVAIIVAHNHPSGSLKPSDEDDEITERLKDACKIMGIHFLDHLIISKDGYYSYRQNGRLPKNLLA